MTDHAKVIGNRLRKCRKDRDWTIAEAAEQMTRAAGEAINITRLNMWELGLRLPKIELFLALAKVYRVPAAYLAALDNDQGAARYVFPQLNPAIDGLSTEQLVGDDAVAFHVDYLAEQGISRDNLVLFRMPDDSMRGAIDRGDRALIDLNDREVLHKGLFALLVNGRLWIRWIRPEVDGRFTITAADAEQYPEKQVDLTELAAFQIIGRVATVVAGR